MSTRRPRKQHEEEHENHERWLITYADMITLLMVLFIVLFAIGQTDLAKYSKLKAGLAGGFHNDGALDGSDGLLVGGPSLTPTPDIAAARSTAEQATAALEEKVAHDAAVQRESAALEHTKEVILLNLTAQGLQDRVQFHRETRGLVVTIVTDRVLFDSGSATLRADGREVLAALVSALTELPNSVAIEGHTDDRPIASAVFPSNWELSTARASSVLRFLVDEHGFPPSRLSAAGYADQRPLAPNDSDASRAQNRRVEVVVLSTVDGEGS
jgi:chemotaxis protein MotB